MRSAPWLALVALAAGCLPRGPAPAGEHVLATRAVSGVQLLPGVGGAPARLLVWQERADLDGADLSVSTLAEGHAGPFKLLAERIDSEQSMCRGSLACSYLVDGRGRIYLRRSSGPRETRDGRPTPMLRIDPSGAVEDLGPVDFLFAVSPSGDRAVLPDRDLSDRIHLEEPGRSTDIDGVRWWSFVGEDLFLVTGMVPSRVDVSPQPTRLSVRRADGTISVVEERVDNVTVHEVGGKTRLVLYRRLYDGNAQHSLLDPATLVETRLGEPIQGGQVTFSSDGRYAAINSWSSSEGQRMRKVMFVDLTTGAQEGHTVMATMGPSGALAWRPGHAEAWISSGLETVVWRPGAALVSLGELDLHIPVRNGSNEGSPFTPDGAFYFSAEFNDYFQVNGFIPVRLVSADDPRSAGLVLNPAGSAMNDLRDLPDGRLLIAAWTTLPQRGDLYLIDPRQGTRKPVASGGNVITTGHTRALAMLRWLEKANAGDLTVLDLASGAHLDLAENVRSWSVDVTRADPLAPGAPIAYFVRSPLPSPFDGLWLAAVP